MELSLLKIIGLINFYTGRYLEKVELTDEMKNKFIKLLLNGDVKSNYICIEDTLYMII